MNAISVVISAWNEEKNLGRTLEALSWADEVIVVDNSSTDKTASIAKKHKATVFTRPNDLMLNKNKNFGFTKATHEWILNLDADEVVTEELRREILAVIKDPNSLNGYWIKRKNIIFGKWIQHGLWWPDKQLRLFRKEKGKFPCKHIHEYIEVEGPSGELVQPYIHYNYETISQYLTKITRATTSEAEVLAHNNYVLAWYDAVRFPLSDFLKNYFAQKGYKDGLHGLVLCLLQAVYSFITFARLWETYQFRQIDIPFSSVSHEVKKSQKEISYWVSQGAIDESSSPLKKLELKLKRKLSS